MSKIQRRTLWVSAAIMGMMVAAVSLAVPQLARTQGLSTPSYFPFLSRNWPTPTATPRPGYLLISEVLYDPDGLEPQGEWVEIFNPGVTAVDLSVYKLGDEEMAGGPEGMFQFPEESFLPPGGVIVVANQAVAFFQSHGLYPDFELYESDPAISNLVKYTSWSGGNVELSNGGDEVLLLDALDQPVDSLSWGSSKYAFDPSLSVIQQGHSYERKPAFQDTDTQQDWMDQVLPDPGKVDVSLPTPTPTLLAGGTPTPHAELSLLVSEVLYDPEGTDPAGEWIEIYNYGDGIIGLDGLRIGDEETQGGGEGMLLFPDGQFIQPGEVLVIANDAEVFAALYGVEPDYAINTSDPQIAKMIRDIQWGSGVVNLSNDGDEVLLLDERGSTIDALSWGSSTFALSPSIAKVGVGHSLERYPPDHDTDSASDWRDQPSPAPGVVELALPTITVTPSPSPELNISK